MDKIKFIHYFVILLIIYTVLQFSREYETVELKSYEELELIDEDEIIVEKKKSSNIFKLGFIITILAIILFFIMLKIFFPRSNTQQLQPRRLQLQQQQQQQQKSRSNTQQQKTNVNHNTLFLYGEIDFKKIDSKKSFERYLKRKTDKIKKYISNKYGGETTVKHVEKIKDEEKIEHIFPFSIPKPYDDDYYRKFFDFVDTKKHRNGTTVYHLEKTPDIRLQNPDRSELFQIPPKDESNNTIYYKKIN